MKRTTRLARARPQPGRQASPSVAAEQAVDILEMGGRGEGVAEGPTGPIYAPLALPGERIRARVIGERAELVAVETASADRRTPPCAAFGRCGGCQVQHWADAPYLAWKRDLVVRALGRRGIEAEVEPIRTAWGEGRRRAAFHASRVAGRLSFGYVARGGARLADIDSCAVLAPALAAALPDLRKLAALLAPERGEITLSCLATDAGVDCDVKGARPLDRRLLEAASAASEKLARVTLAGAPLAQHAKPQLRMGDAMVFPPPGAFLQPTAEGEAALAALALEALDGGGKKVVDLFCGLGTFALRAARSVAVHAVDSEMALLQALKEAADSTVGALRPITTARRDLLRTPLSAMELKTFDAAILDPPRAGARMQALELAKSRIARIASVSCDASTFARDARTLIDGGFRLTRVTPVDQFRWTPHVEIVAAFER